MDSSHQAGSSSVTSLSVAGSVQGQTISPASLLRANNLSASNLVFSSLTSPRSSFNGEPNILGNLNNAAHGVGFPGLNTGVFNSSSGLALPGNAGPGGAPVQLNSGVVEESVGFTGLPPSTSSLSFPTSSLEATRFMANSLNRHGPGGRINLQEVQQLNSASIAQFRQDSQQLPQHQLEHQHQQHRQQQQLNNQQSLGLQQMQGLASVKLEQQLMHQQGQSLGSVKMDPQTDSSLRQQLVQGLTPVKFEQLDTTLRQQLQQHQSARALNSQSISPVKLEQDEASLQQQLQHQQAQTLQGIGPMKLDLHQQEQPLHTQITLPKLEVKSDVEMPNSLAHQSLLTSQLQKHETLQLHRQQPQQFYAQMNLLQHQRLLQHRSQIQQQQLRQHLAGASKQLMFEPGICARRLMEYMFNQRQRSQSNDIYFWRRFVAEFFSRNAKKRWCVSRYGNNGRQTTGVFPQDVWHCEICGSRPGRGFETTVEVLPRLCKIKYDSGILDELLFVDMLHEYRLSSGFMVLEYGKAIQESIFEQLRVVREGQLRIIFTPELKIHLWEFCASGHEELIPRRVLVPQVTQLAAIAQKYQNSLSQNQNVSTTASTQELHTNCQLFVTAARQLTRTLEAPTVNDLGYTKRYVRCLQISEVVNSMKDLIDFSREKRMGPIDSLLNFPRRPGMIRSAGGDVLQHQEQRIQSVSREQAMPSFASTGNSNLTGVVSTTEHPGKSSGSLPNLLPQNASTSFQNSIQVNGTSPSLNTPSNEGAISSLGSSQHAYLSSLRNFNLHSSRTGHPSSPASTLCHGAQQNSLSSAVTLLQKSSGQFLQGNLLETSNLPHQIQDPRMGYQLKNGTLHQQQVLEGVTNGKSATGSNGAVTTSGAGNLLGNANGLGMTSGPGNLPVNVNGPGSSSNMSEAIGGGVDGPVMGSAVSDSDSGNLGGVTSSFSEVLVNESFLSGNGNNIMGIGSSLSVNNAENVTTIGAMHSPSMVNDDQALGLQDPNQSFLNDYGGSDILSTLSNSTFSSLPFSWKSP
ncbi:hypothetical protein KP509_01G063700 [Ceratopteris richardii]|uniref:Transcriptional regulator SLK2 n=1 Tax=Ceratopteris richardii TaxID=49495 RepID=A0A8T2VDM8_CERRI|nr:hypothetical protein KP509_01G063700 [Ceratopteris richardii]